MRIALVGNAPNACGFGPLIDRHDFVVRFNRTAYFGWAGRRTDALVLNNVGRPARYVVDGRYKIDPRALESARELWFPMAPETIEYDRRINLKSSDPYRYTDLAPAMIDALGPSVPVRTIPLGTWVRAAESLGGFGRTKAQPLTSAAIALQYLLDHWPEVNITLFGFTHEGFVGHAWDAERQWMDSLLNVRRVRWCSVGALARSAAYATLDTISRRSGVRNESNALSSPAGRPLR